MDTLVFQPTVVALESFSFGLAGFICQYTLPHSVNPILTDPLSPGFWYRDFSNQCRGTALRLRGFQLRDFRPPTGIPRPKSLLHSKETHGHTLEACDL